MNKFRNLIWLILFIVGTVATSCAKDSTMDEVDGSMLTQPYEGNDNDTSKPPGGG